ncbi:hypothetical protein GOP47_0002346 [Adiantum capillus-veneris]|uniref:Uncharacterized protein n=1 Tax=Adiantum capillus-veneris TaxID=13818 RepID=A0A9D4VAG1_ADICA|nr:hypothetical protein GOP47_0002346 [Adiantum capillus-veneris]
MGDAVLDCFAGVGTLAAQCLLLCRHHISCEKDWSVFSACLGLGDRAYSSAGATFSDTSQQSGETIAAPHTTFTASLLAWRATGPSTSAFSASIFKAPPGVDALPLSLPTGLPTYGSTLFHLEEFPHHLVHCPH